MYQSVFVSVLIAVLSVPAVAKDKALDWIPSENQTRKFYKGKEAIESRLPTSIVRVFEPTPNPGDRAEMWLVVLNDTGQEVVVSHESLSAATSDGSGITIVPYAELAVERRRAHKRRSVLTAIGNAFAAGGNSGMRTADGRVSGFVDGELVSADLDITYYDPHLAASQQQATQAQIERNQRELAQRISRDLVSLEENIQPTSLPNGEQMQAKFTIEWPSSVRRSGKSTPVTFVVQVGNDKHVLNANVSDAY